MPSQLFQAIVLFFFKRKQSLGASTQTLWMWNPHPGRPPQLITSGLFSSPFLFLWLFTAAAEKRAFSNVHFARRPDTLSEGLRADFLMLNQERQDSGMTASGAAGNPDAPPALLTLSCRSRAQPSWMSAEMTSVFPTTVARCKAVWSPCRGREGRDGGQHAPAPHHLLPGFTTQKVRTSSSVTKGQLGSVIQSTASACREE